MKTLFEKNKGSLALLLAALFWGSTFVAQSDGMNYLGPHSYNACRFLLGFLILFPFACLSLKKSGKGKEYVKASIVGGLIVGIPEAIASSLQQVGILYASASKAGFLTALYIVIVPLMSYLVYRKKLTANVYIAVAVAVGGFYLLSVKNDGAGFTVGFADIILVLCAVVFSIQILCIDYYAKSCDAITLSAFQFFVSTIFAAVMAFFFEDFEIIQAKNALIPIAYAGIFSCGIAYTLQIVGQKYTEPTIASLLMSLESVFAAVFGFLILHDQLSLRELLGCVLIFAAVILSQVEPGQWKQLVKRS